MIMKSIGLVFLVGIISVASLKITEPVEKSQTKTGMPYGWRITFPTYDGKIPLHECNGVFIIPRVFITNAWCMMRNTLGRDDGKYYISKLYHGYSNNSRVLTVKSSNIYYHEDLSDTYDLDELQVAVLITDDPVKPELDENEYIQLNSNFDDVNTTSCFVPSYDSWNITFTSCETAYIKSDDPQHVYCLSRDLSKFSGNSFICHLEAYPDVKVMVGVLTEFSDLTKHDSNAKFKLFVIENVSGLENVITEKIKSIL
ncbi:hypothetical protein KQX54_019267 [Cotesia glomerata]|uniref:Peptidase S1 domain-containing protein n=1 Tax=Cotesia glomerata TaxID=32391 RepID=A0AAV7I0J8_COTGL|nr:hypothetical protein KQX54_019267 [Cotesia glomerata]